MYTFEDLPIACQEQGCDKECPGKALIKEKPANLRTFLLERNKKTLSNILAETSTLTYSRLGVLPDAPYAAPPPSLSRLDKSKVPSELCNFDNALSVPALKPPGSPHPSNCVLPDCGSISQHARDAETHIAQIKTSMARIKDHLSDSHASHISGREAVNSWLQRANNTKGSSDQGNHDCAVDTGTYVPLDGELVHHKKSPVGLGPVHCEGHEPKSTANKQRHDGEANASDKPRNVAATVPCSRHSTDGEDGLPGPSSFRPSSTSVRDESQVFSQNIGSLPPVASTSILFETPVTHSPQHVELDDDMPPSNSDEEAAILATLANHGDRDIYRNFSISGSDHQAAETVSNDIDKESEQKTTRAYRRHVKITLRRNNARSAQRSTPPTLVTARNSITQRSGSRAVRTTRMLRSIPVWNERPRFSEANERRVGGKVRSNVRLTEKASGHDKKMLEDLFKKP